MSAEFAPPSNRSALQSAIRRILLGHRIRPGDRGSRGVGRASNVVTAIASVLIIAGVIGAPIALTVAELAFHGSRSTAGDLWTLCLLAIAVGFTLRFVGAVVNLSAQSFAQPRSRVATTFITAGFAAVTVAGAFLLLWALALLAVVIAL